MRFCSTTFLHWESYVEWTSRVVAIRLGAIYYMGQGLLSTVYIYDSAAATAGLAVFICARAAMSLSLCSGLPTDIRM